MKSIILSFSILLSFAPSQAKTNLSFESSEVQPPAFLKKICEVVAESTVNQSFNEDWEHNTENHSEITNRTPLPGGVEKLEITISADLPDPNNGRKTSVYEVEIEIVGSICSIYTPVLIDEYTKVD